MDLDEYERLLGDIYEAAWAPERWQAVLDRLAGMTDSTIAQLYLANPAEQRILMSLCGGDAARIAAANPAYVDYYGGIDPRGALSAQKAPGEWLLCHEHFDERFAARNEFYQDYLRPNGFRYAMGTSLLREGNVLASFGLLDERRAFDRDSHLPLMQRLTPHLQRALRLSQRLQQLEWQAGAGLQFLERLPYPALICHLGGKLGYANQAAQRLMTRERCLNVEQGRLVCAQPQVQHRLRALIDNAIRISASVLFEQTRPCRGEPGTLSLRSPVSGQQHPLSVLPLPVALREHGYGLAEEGALLLFGRQAGETPGLDHWLTTLYRCTPAEVRLARLLLAGLGPEEAAAQLGIKMPTVRTQLRQLFAKTGTERQPELIRLLMALPVA